jgi:mono/diheme cytochrome c family protein
MSSRPLLLAAAVLAAAGCTSRFVRPTTDARVEVTPERVKRGEYLVKAVGACGACHDGRPGGDLLQPADPALALAGGNMLRDGSIGAWVPNITNDAETGLGRWSDDEIVRALRDGVRPDGRFLLPLMPYGAYQHMSDEDAAAIVAYLRAAPAVREPRPREEHQVPFPMKVALGLGAAMHAPVGSVPAPDRTDAVAYGGYLARLGHCTECHSMGRMGVRGEGDRWMAGSDGPMRLPGVGKVWASNLTPHAEAGLGGRSAGELTVQLVAGLRKDGKRVAPPMSLYVPHLAQYAPEDLAALVAWLQALPPVAHAVPPRELTPELAKQVGE